MVYFPSLNDRKYLIVSRYAKECLTQYLFRIISVILKFNVHYFYNVHVSKAHYCYNFVQIYTWQNVGFFFSANAVFL